MRARTHTHTHTCSFRGVCTCMQVNKNIHAIQLHTAYTHTHTYPQHMFVFNVSLKSLHIPKLTPACPTYSHAPLPSTYVQTLTCTQMMHMCDYPTTHGHTHTLVYSLACPGNMRKYTFKHTQCNSYVHILNLHMGGYPVQTLPLPPLISLCRAPLSLPTLIHFLSLGRILRLLIASAT